MRLKGTIFSYGGKETFDKDVVGIISELADVKFITATEKLGQDEFVRLIKDDHFFAPTPRSYPQNRFPIGKLQNLKGVFLPTTGVNWFNSADYLNEGKFVSNVLDFSTVSCAEFTWNLIQNMARNTQQNQIQMNNMYLEMKYAPGMELRGKTLGIWGLGRIGSEVAKFGHAFGMKVLSYDIKTDSHNALLEMVSQSDFLTLHIPHTIANTGIVNAEILSCLKPGCKLINTSRPGLLNYDDVLSALKGSKLAGLALDIGYEDKKNFEPFLVMSNVMIFPHISWYTKDAVVREKQFWVQNILGFLENREFHQISINDC